MADDALTTEQLLQKMAAAGGAPPAADDGLTSDELIARASKTAAPQDKQHYLSGFARSLLGQGALMGWGDEAMARLRQIAKGEDYESAVKDERAKVKEFRKENPKTALAAELGGGFLTPGLGLLTGALKPAASTLGRITQGVGVGSSIGTVAGAGAAEGDESTFEGAKKGAAFGAVVGPVAPVVGKLASGAIDKLSDVVGPTLARLGAKITPGGKSTPAEAAADYVQIRDMKSEGLTPALVRERLAAVDRDRTFHGGVGAANASEAETPIMLMDMSPGQRKLAGAIARASPETGSRAEAVIGARQTGITPGDPKAQQFVEEAGLTTRNPLSPMEATEVLTSPAGQHERYQGALQKAYTLADTKHHGFAENGYRTEKDMRAALKAQEDKLYGDFRSAQAGYDVRPDMQTAITKWTDKLADAQVDEGAIIRQGLRAFTTDGKEWVKTADNIDKGKRAIDAKIQAAKQAVDNNKVRILTELQRDFMNAAEGIQHNDIGKKWAAAREYSSTERQRLDALQWGREAPRANSNASAEEFAAFPEDQKKLARFGILEALGTGSADKKRAADLSQWFDTNRAQALLRETIPRSKGAGPYSVQPERFGNYIGHEKEFIRGRDVVLGNSATAGRLADDERLTRQTLSTMFDRFKSGNLGLVPMALEAVSVGLTKMFGYREDVARELGRRMFTANRAELDRILARLEAQWGTDKVGALTRFIDNATTAAAVALPSAGARAIGEGRRK